MYTKIIQKQIEIYTSTIYKRSQPLFQYFSLYFSPHNFRKEIKKIWDKQGSTPPHSSPYRLLFETQKYTLCASLVTLVRLSNKIQRTFCLLMYFYDLPSFHHLSPITNTYIHTQTPKSSFHPSSIFHVSYRHCSTLLLPSFPYTHMHTPPKSRCWPASPSLTPLHMLHTHLHAHTHSITQKYSYTNTHTDQTKNAAHHRNPDPQRPCGCAG